MKYVFRCEKLVRDRIPELLAGPDNILEIEVLNQKAHILALKKKLKEEADEVFLASSKEEIIEEIADVKEVLDALIQQLSISCVELLEIKRQKNLREGGFDRGLYLKTVAAPKDSPIASRLLKDPNKYPFVI